MYLEKHKPKKNNEILHYQSLSIIQCLTLDQHWVLSNHLWRQSMCKFFRQLFIPAKIK